MSKQLTLNETELLLLQQQMEGDISGVGYSLETAGVDTADYRGREGEDLYEAPAVQEADRTGWIRKIKFHIDDPRDLDNDRTVLLHIYRDGHIRCERFVEPIVADKVMSEIDSIREYKDFLTPLNELLGNFIEARYQGRPSFRSGDYITDVNDEFSDLIDEYFDTTGMTDKQRRLYISIIANVGLQLCENGVPDTSSYEDIVDTEQESLDIDSDDALKDFFKQYSKRIYGEDIDYSELTNHLEHILSQPWIPSSSNNNSPLEIIEYVIEFYDITT